MCILKSSQGEKSSFTGHLPHHRICPHDVPSFLHGLASHWPLTSFVQLPPIPHSPGPAGGQSTCQMLEQSHCCPCSHEYPESFSSPASSTCSRRGGGPRSTVFFLPPLSCFGATLSRQWHPQPLAQHAPHLSSTQTLPLHTEPASGHIPEAVQ